MDTIKTDIKRAVFSMPFLVSIAIMTFVIIFGAGRAMLFPQNVKYGLFPFYHMNMILTSLTEPSGEMKRIQEGAELIAFDEIMDILRQQILIQGAWNGVVEVKSRKLFIDEITLGYMKIAVPDNPDEFILTPVWDFFGYQEAEYDEDTYTGLILDENNRYRTRDFRHSYLTINAIDGSIIDRSLGY